MLITLTTIYLQHLSDTSRFIKTHNSRPNSWSSALWMTCIIHEDIWHTLRWKALGQWSHANGLNPVCLRLWVMRFDDWLKALPHWRQTYGFSPTTHQLHPCRPPTGSTCPSETMRQYTYALLHLSPTSIRSRSPENLYNGSKK